MRYTAKKFCNGDENNRIKFKFYSWKDNGYHKPYGEFVTTLRQLKMGETKYELYKIDTRVPIAGAQFEFQELYVEQRPSFYDFLHSGWQMNLSVAIDFTASNGPIQYPDSLHYMNPTGQMNEYQAALHSVGSILVNYDSDRLIPAFGFGGIPLYSGTNEVSHCFHLNGAENPQCIDVPGLMEAYQFSLTNVKLYGPTLFSPCLQVFYDFMMQNIQNPVYHVVLIITDGDIHDMAQTKELVVAASSKPISIIIVGVGNENFELMEELDADTHVLRNKKGEAAMRDIVQFVRYRDYAQMGFQALSEEVLREIPDQVVEYFVRNGIKLGP